MTLSRVACSPIGGTSACPETAARKWAHWARKEAVKASSRESPPVGDTSWGTPLSSFQTWSGLMPAVPLLPRSPTPNRSPSPMWRQVTSTKMEGPFSHTTYALPYVAPADPPPVLPRAAAAGRLGERRPAPRRRGRPRQPEAEIEHGESEIEH